MCRPCFAAANSYQQLYIEYGHIAQYFTGWTLAELRAMTGRERRHWCELVARRLGLEKRTDGE